MHRPIAARRLARVVVGVAIAVLALPATVAAQSASPQPPASLEPAASPVAAEPGLDGSWDVSAFDAWGEGLAGPRRGTTLSVSLLGAGRLEGETGCGDYYGRYLLDGDSISLRVISKGPDPCSVEATEEAVAFSVALEAVVSWRVTDSGLELLDETGAVRVALERVDEQGLGGDWIAERYWRANGRAIEPLPGSPVAISFGADGSVSGSTGCRLLDGAYMRVGNQLIVAPVEPVGLPCDGDLRRQERRLLRILDQIVLWQREGDTLRLTDGSGQPLLELRAAPSAEVAAPSASGAPGTSPAPDETDA